MTSHRAPVGVRSFDPSAVARLETDVWVAYYRHDWIRLVRSAVSLSRQTFAMSWQATLRCSWLLLRATQVWSPIPDNDPGRARQLTERLYRIVAERSGESFDPAVAAVLELEWWRVHRDVQHAVPGSDERALVDALGRLYAYVYDVPEASVRIAAEQRALAMRHSDQWVREGCRLDSGLLDSERAALEASYVSLLAAVARVPRDPHVDDSPRPQAPHLQGASRPSWSPPVAAI